MKFDLKVAKGLSIQTLSMEANDIAEACIQAESQGFSILATNTKKSFKPQHFSKSKFDLMLFSQELLSLVKSGLSLVEAIEALAEK